jgi:hypothetical protein
LWWAQAIGEDTSSLYLRGDGRNIGDHKKRVIGDLLEQEKSKISHNMSGLRR